MFDWQATLFTTVYVPCRIQRYGCERAVVGDLVLLGCTADAPEPDLDADADGSTLMDEAGAGGGGAGEGSAAVSGASTRLSSVHVVRISSLLSMW